MRYHYSCIIRYVYKLLIQNKIFGRPTYSPNYENFFSLECRITTKAHTYTGTQHITPEGRTCQHWDQTSPHEFNLAGR